MTVLQTYQAFRDQDACHHFRTIGPAVYDNAIPLILLLRGVNPRLTTFEATEIIRWVWEEAFPNVQAIAKWERVHGHHVNRSPVC